MGKPVANHWSRLIILTAGTAQLVASLFAFFWPKFFFDTITKNLDAAVKPVPVLQIINLCLALLVLALDWPLSWIAYTQLHASFEARLLIVYPTAATAAVLLYQGMPAAAWYVIGMCVLIWGYCRGEVSVLASLLVSKRAC